MQLASRHSPFTPSMTGYTLASPKVAPLSTPFPLHLSYPSPAAAALPPLPAAIVPVPSTAAPVAVAIPPVTAAVPSVTHAIANPLDTMDSRNANADPSAAIIPYYGT